MWTHVLQLSLIKQIELHLMCYWDRTFKRIQESLIANTVKKTNNQTNQQKRTANKIGFIVWPEDCMHVIDFSQCNELDLSLDHLSAV